MTFRDLEKNTDPISKSSDNFGQLIADSKTNEADIAGQYPFSPERWRLFKNGTRQFVQYGSITGFSDNVDGYTISPSGGEAWKMETAERFRYSVGYVIEPSFAFKINQSLKNDDIVVIGYGEPDINSLSADSTDLTTVNPDGWFIKITSSGAEFNMYRDGTKAASKSLSLNKALTVLSRFAMKLNWYDVGSAILEETYTSSGIQRNPELAEIGNDDGKGPQNANKRFTFSVRPDSSTSNLQLEIGSVGVKTLGEVDKISREKSVFKSGLNIGTTDTWEPIYAMRTDPDKDLVSMVMTNLEVLKFDSADDVELLVISVDPSKTDASGWSFPEETHDPNNAFQETTSVAEVPNESGTQTDPGSDFSPGGFSVGHAVLTTDAGGQTNGGFIGGVRRQRPLYDSDILVFLGRSGSTGNISFRFSTEQFW